jgi:hypothetical protein
VHVGRHMQALMETLVCETFLQDLAPRSKQLLLLIGRPGIGYVERMDSSLVRVT